MEVVVNLPAHVSALLDETNSIYLAQLRYALGWTVVHALWQGVLIALLLVVTLAALRRQRAHIRYVAAIIAQVLMLVCGLFTFSLLLDTAENSLINQETFFFRDTYGALANAPAAPDWYQPIDVLRDFLDRHIASITAIWLCGVGLFSLRLLGTWVYTRRLARHAVHPVSLVWQQRFQQLRLAMQVAPVVQLLESAVAKTPMVIGHLKPVVLLPIGLLTSLPPEQVEALLAHELAHIRRRDYLVNLLLSVLEILFFFHPVVWWIGRVIRREREYCCDEIAVQTAGSSITFAKALAALSTQQKPQSLAMAASGKPKELLYRVKRILLEQPSNQTEIMEKTIATLLIVGSVLFFYMRADAAQIETPSASSPGTSAIIRDTIPSGKITIKQQINGKSLEAQLEDGKIITLQVDGKEIPKESFGAYEEQVSQLLEKIPPRPPVPPRPGTPPTPDMPKSHFYFLDLEGKDTLLLDESWDMSGHPLSEEMAKRFEEQAARMAELAARMAEKGIRMRLDDIDIRLNDLFPEDAKKQLEELKELEIELPGFRIEGDFNLREDQNAEELGIFEFPRGRKMNTQQQLERALLRDELIERNGMYKFELSDRTLKINGDKLPDSLRKKYIRLYEDASGMEWDAKKQGGHS